MRRKTSGIFAVMLTRRTLMISAACAVVTTAARAADASPLAFVTEIYHAYRGKNALGHPLDNEWTILRYFAPSLAAMMVKDQRKAARRGDVGLLDFDPFVDAQEWDISDFDVEVRETAPGKAGATVKFTNLGEAKNIALDLVATNGDWRINDITWRRDGKPSSLRAMYAH